MAKRRRGGGRDVGPCGDRGTLLKHRARRCARRGEYRKAAVALREAVALDGDAASWTLLGEMLRRARRGAEAVRAFKQAEWLHRRAGSPRRADVVARLIAAAHPRAA